MHSEQEYNWGRVGKANGNFIANPDEHIPYFVPVVQSGRTVQVSNDGHAGEMRHFESYQTKFPGTHPRSCPASINLTTNYSMPPEKIILLPATHESLPSFHVQGDLLPSFLDHLANSGIKVPEPPEPHDNFEPGAVFCSGGGYRGRHFSQEASRSARRILKES